MNTFELVRNGYEKDIVVYDSEGVGLTKRLLSHLKNIARRELFTIDKFILDPSSDIYINDWFFESLSGIGEVKNKDLSGLILLGIPVEFENGLSELSVDKKYVEYYSSLGGNFPVKNLGHFNKNNSLILAVNNHGSILGAY